MPDLGSSRTNGMEKTLRGGSRWEREVEMRLWKGFSPGPTILSWFPRCWEEMRWKARVGNKTGRGQRDC